MNHVWPIPCAAAGPAESKVNPASAASMHFHVEVLPLLDEPVLPGGSPSSGCPATWLTFDRDSSLDEAASVAAAELDDIVLGRPALRDSHMGEMIIVNMIDRHLADTLAMERGRISLR